MNTLPSGPSAVVGGAKLYHADCRDVLKSLPDNSIDSIVTDPPYALVSIQKRFGKPGSKPAKDVYGRGAAGFMGKQWDTGEVAFSEVFWAECLRVLKPGGHVVAFSGTRTYHRMAVAIEDAGFEIRDQLGWLYGSGFPKSHDVSKGIDKKRDDLADIHRVAAFVAAGRDAAAKTNRDIDALFGFNGMAGHWTNSRGPQAQVPKCEQWIKIKKFLSLSDEMDGEVSRLNGRKGEYGEAWQAAEVIGVKEGAMSGWSMDGETKFVDREVKTANSDAARQWQGWGTALKPSWEPICLARKPLIGTVAENVLAHGTGAINIDGTRVPGGAEHSLGRWPANIVHDGSDEVLAAFPVTGAGGKASGAKAGSVFASWGDATTTERDSGSAARFFYCAKASRKDRDEGLEGFSIQDTAAMQGNLTSGQPLAGNGTPITTPKRANTHPTVKPTDLMRWLCRLVTPPGGVILDPFMGSGSTGKAALLEGFRFIGCEREDEYMPIAEARIAAALRPVAAQAQPAAHAPAVPTNDNAQRDLFDVA